MLPDCAGLADVLVALNGGLPLPAVQVWDGGPGALASGRSPSVAAFMPEIVNCSCQ